MARVENDSSDSEDGDAILSFDGEVEDGNLDVEKDDTDDESITSEDEDESVIEQKIVEFEGKIFENPYVYKNHVELISLLGQLGNRARLRSAYERLSTLFPLDSKQWVLWLQLEVDSVTTPEARQLIYELFERAFLDCYSGAIFMEWCAMSMSSEDEARVIIPQALEAAGSDPMDGTLLWDTAKEFELAHLSVISATSLTSDTYTKQVHRVAEIFVNQLSRPLFRSKSLLDEFRSFVRSHKDQIPDVEEKIKEIEEAHTVSDMILKNLLEFENELEIYTGDTAEDVSEKCTVYIKYIDYVKGLVVDHPEPNNYKLRCLLNVLFDRATSECVASLCRLEPAPMEQAEELCRDYVEFAKDNLQDQYCLKVMEKVIKRCPRKCSLWLYKLRQIEHMGYSMDKIKTEFEAALYAGFHCAQDYVDVWMCYLETLRRKTDFSSMDEVERLRKTFRLSWESLGQMWGDTADTEFSILQFWARIEYQHSKDHEYGKELFDEIFQYGDNSLRGGIWLEFITMEKQRGSVNRVRTCFKRAVRNSPDPRLHRAWLALERDHGTLETLLECTNICEERAKEWETVQEEMSQLKEQEKSSRNQQQYSKYQSNDKNTMRPKGKKKKKGKQAQANRRPPPQERPTAVNNQERQIPINKERQAPANNQQVPINNQEIPAINQQSPINNPILVNNQEGAILINAQELLVSHIVILSDNQPPAKKMKYGPENYRDNSCQVAINSPKSVSDSNVNSEDKKVQENNTVEQNTIDKNNTVEQNNIVQDIVNCNKRKSDDEDTPSKRMKSDQVMRSTLAPPKSNEALLNQHEVDTNITYEVTRTVFVSNLDFNVNEAELKKKLLEFGDIETMKVVTGVKTYGSICYCEYKNPESALVALSHDRDLLDGRPMFISKYCPTKNERPKVFVYPTSIERNKLFVKNIAFDHCTDKKLKDVFSKYGQLKAIRLVNFRNGKPKGLAYVEYTDEKGANAALQATDGLDLGGRAISVALSAPPPRKKDPQSSMSAPPPPSSTRGHARTMLFIPSVLQRPSTSKAIHQMPDPPDKAKPTEDEKNQVPSTSKLSNSDFRNMILGKK